MARSDYVTQLALDRYAQIMGIIPTHFNQLAGNVAPVFKKPDDLWDQPARDDLAWTISQAEEMIARELGFWAAPKFIVNEEIPFNLPGIRSDWLNAEVETEFSQIESFGTESLTLLEAGATVTYTDDDNDPFSRKELATIGDGVYNYLDACGSACEVAVFFRVVDGADDAADERWEIRPLRVDIDGSTMTLKGESSLFVKPSLWKLTEAECKASENQNAWIINFETGNLVTAVDVYCRTVNTTLPLEIRWDGICNCTSPCSHETQTACAYTTDKKRGFFVPRSASGANVYATPTNAVPPESVLANYRAGLPLKNCQMNPNLEKAIVKLTNALLPEPPCGFNDMAKRRWDTDRANVDPLTPEAASLPWDVYKQGALEAWRIVKMFARGRGGKMGRGYR